MSFEKDGILVGQVFSSRLSFFAFPLLNLTSVVYSIIISGRFARIVLDFTFDLFQCFGVRFTVTVLPISDSVGVHTKVFVANIRKNV